MALVSFTNNVTVYVFDSSAEQFWRRATTFALVSLLENISSLPHY